MNLNHYRYKANQGDLDIENNEKFNLFGNNHCDIIENVFWENNISCMYYDEDKFCSIKQIKNNILCLSFNIQSIGAKFTEFNNFLNHLFSNKIIPDLICLQEIWNVPSFDDFKIDGYNIFVKSRTTGRGAGFVFM